jgi:hypothetical protein
VESEYDVPFYDKMNEKLKNELIPEISLSFIPSGLGGSGSCQQVKNIVKTLRQHGNKTVSGIIDWDTQNCSNDFVKVLGAGKRYTIENYIFDPIMLAAFLIRERMIPRGDLGISHHNELDKLPDERLQEIANYILDRLCPIDLREQDQALEEVEYINGKKISIPVWFLKMNGHRLVGQVINTFEALKRYSNQNEVKLKQEIIDKAIDELPGFIPVEILALLKEIQEL